MKRFIFAIGAMLLLNICCFADGPSDDIYQKFETDTIVENIPYQAKELVDQIVSDRLTLDKLTNVSPIKIKEIFKEKVIEHFTSYKTQLISIMIAVILSAALSTVGGEGSHTAVFDLVCILMITALLIEPILICIQHSCETVKELSRFMLLYIPIYATVMISSGSAGTAAVYHTSLMAAAQIIGQLSGRVFLPLMQGYMLISLSGTIGGNKGIKSAASAVKKTVNWGLAAAATAFTGILSIQSFISSAADSAASKTVKFIAGSFVPIIGGAFSDALSAIQGSIRLIKASVGGAGIVITVLTFMPILIRITVLRAVLWSAKLSGDILSADKCSDILSCFLNILSALTALLLTVMMVFIISTAVMINTVSNL